MKTTGVVRRIDDLGRIVIPKEIRRTLKIREGDSLEIIVTQNGNIDLKKYSPLGDIKNICQAYIEANKDLSIIVTDIERIITSSKEFKKYEGVNISLELEEVILNKKETKDFHFEIVSGLSYDGNAYIKPIVAYGDIYGAIILCDSSLEEKDIIKINGFSKFLENYLVNI